MKQNWSRPWPIFNKSKNSAVLEPRAGHFRGLAGFEVKAKDFKLCPRGFHLWELMFELYYSFFHYCLMPCCYVMFQNRSLSKRKRGAQVVVWGVTAPCPPPTATALKQTNVTFSTTRAVNWPWKCFFLKKTRHYMLSISAYFFSMSQVFVFQCVQKLRSF